MVIVEEGLDMAYGLPATVFLAKRALAIPCCGAALLGGAASALVIFGPQIGNLIKDSSPVAARPLARSGRTALGHRAGTDELLVLTVVFLAPIVNVQMARPPGGILATVLWALVSLGFSLYTTSFGSYGRPTARLREWPY